MTDRQSVAALVTATEETAKKEARAYVGVAILHVRVALSEGADEAAVWVHNRYAHCLIGILQQEYGLEVRATTADAKFTGLTVCHLKAWHESNKPHP